MIANKIETYETLLQHKRGRTFCQNTFQMLFSSSLPELHSSTQLAVEYWFLFTLGQIPALVSSLQTAL